MLEFTQRSGEQRGFFRRPDGMPEVLHHLLMQRGITTAAEAEAFLHPCEAQLRDPFLLSDMAEAVGIIRRSVEAGEKICVYGDYDVDGVCASAVMYLYLHSIGADVRIYLPSRHEEGYGLNENAVREIAKDCKLLLTVDCGISCHDLIELAKSLGMTCVVTDHHRPGETIPECPVVNPLLGGYPFGYICGTGVAFKLVWALGGRDAAMALIDLAAIATVADVVPLKDENRAIVYLGLERINASPRKGVKALIENAGLKVGTLTSRDIAFRLGPRINAGGRIGSASVPYELLISEDDFQVTADADLLETQNTSRREIEKKIREAAETQLEDFDFTAHRIIMVRGEGWNPGVIGLAASHLKEKYHYPVIVFAEHEGLLTGSCRSIEGVDIFQALCRADDLLMKYGGHAQAAGLTLEAGNFDALRERLDRYLTDYIPAQVWLPKAEYDIPASIADFSESTVRMLSALEPTGKDNPEPVFLADVSMLEKRRIGAGGAHLRIVAAQDGKRCTGVFFGAGDRADDMDEEMQILFTPQLNSWNGRTDVQLMLHDMRQTDAGCRIRAARPDEGEMQRKFLTDLLYNGDIRFDADAEAIGADDLSALLEDNAQGVWVVCASLDIAGDIMGRTGEVRPDLVIGHMPADRRAFSSVIVCPEHITSLPGGVRTLVTAGVPAIAAGKDIKTYVLACAGGLAAADVPTVDGMREVYKALRAFIRQGLRLQSLEEWTEQLSLQCALSQTACHLSVLALCDMKLIETRNKPFSLQLLPAAKTDPETSAIWRSIQRLKGGGI